MRFSRLVQLAALCSLTVACAQPRPIPIGSDTSFYGYLTTGVKFDVSIGDEQSTARSVIEGRGFDFVRETDCAESVRLQEDLACSAGDRYELYDRHAGSGHEWIYVGVTGGHVRSMAWSFSILQLDS